MTLNRNKMIVRYYLWLVGVYRDEWSVDYRLSHGTSLCMFFWRVVLGTAGIAVAVGVLLGAIWLFVSISINEPWAVLSVVGIVIASFAAMAAILWGFSFTGKFMRSDNLVSGYLKAAKRGICPLIKFSDTDR